MGSSILINRLTHCWYTLRPLSRVLGGYAGRLLTLESTHLHRPVARLHRPFTIYTWYSGCRIHSIFTLGRGYARHERDSSCVPAPLWWGCQYVADAEWRCIQLSIKRSKDGWCLGDYVSGWIVGVFFWLSEFWHSTWPVLHILVYI